MTYRLKILIHFMMVDTNEDNKLKVEEEEVYEEEDIMDHKKSWIEKSEDDCQEGIVDKEESSADQEIKVKARGGNVVNGMVILMEEALKNHKGFEGFEDQEKVFKFLSIYTIRKDHSRKQIGCENG
ncbi:hypothetical protein M9H77_30919 [Catharanthus roseus]|uniref:Uncharacterized protein n=1 Tax=Catharanthus roseus TaxID=4058 RepID=A0ACC0A199_CATRO|nr:hypothetical protein M9H77_30919 [Catharanthus roseus]